MKPLSISALCGAALFLAQLWAAQFAVAETKAAPITIKSPHAEGRAYFLVRFSPHGKLIATGGGDALTRLWDTATGAAVRAFGTRASADEDIVSALAFSPDAALLATVGYLGVARVWDVASGELKYSLKGPGGPLREVMFSPDGAHLVVGDEEGRLQLWDLKANKVIFEPESHRLRVTKMHFSADGGRLLTTDDTVIRMWDWSAQKLLFTVEDTPLMAWTLSMRPDGRQFATGGRNGEVRVWDAATGARLLALDDQKAMITGLAYSADGRRLIISRSDGRLRLRDAATGKVLKALDVGDHGVAISRDGGRLATYLGRTLTVLSAHDFSELARWPDKRDAPGGKLLLGPFGRKLVSWSFELIKIRTLARPDL
ncbi:MAG: hypothetical protein MRY74_13345 [Neomegalonema sp.]|nr:hypothetical protein [Neomegalonema sp.]